MFSSSATPMSRVILSSVLLCLVALVASNNKDVELYRNLISESEDDSLFIVVSQVASGIEAGSTPSLTCNTRLPSQIWWTRGDNKLSTIKESDLKGRIDIQHASRNDSGNYTCHTKALNGGTEETKTIEIKVYEPGRIVPEKSIKPNLSQAGTLRCHVYGDPIKNVTWSKGNDTDSEGYLKNHTSTETVNGTYYIMSLKFDSVGRKDNGTYTCSAVDYNGLVSAQTHLYVLDIPQVILDFIKPVSTSSIYMNWTVHDWNDPIISYYINFLKNGTERWQFNSEQVSGEKTSHVLKRLEKSTAYQIKISAKNSIGTSHSYTDPRWIKTLDEDPVFIPKVALKGSTAHSISIAWNKPPPPLAEYIHFYNLKLYHTESKTSKEASLYPTPTTKRDMNIGYLFDGLQAATIYNFKVKACNEYTKTCGNWSQEGNGTTLDGVSGPPQNFTVTCGVDADMGNHYIALSWAVPLHPNGQIWQYRAKISGVSHYINNQGQLARDDEIVINKTFHENEYKSKIPNVTPNTNYTVSIAGLTKSMSPGEEAYGHCSTPPAMPNRDDINFSWLKVQSDGKHFFELNLPRVTERNGPICCYRIFMVKLEPQTSVAQLPPPKEIPLLTYTQVHEMTETGAYLAEMFDSVRLVPEIFLGDGELTTNVSGSCLRCIGKRLKPFSNVVRFVPDDDAQGETVEATSPPTESTVVVSSITPIATTTAVPPVISSSTTPNVIVTTDNFISTDSSDVTEKSTKRKRNLAEETKSKGFFVEHVNLPHDGILDDRSNYTGFIEFIVYGEEEGHNIIGYTNYFNPLFAGMDPVNMAATEAVALGVILNVLLGITIIMIFIITLYLLHKFTKRDDQRGEEVINLRSSFSHVLSLRRHLCRSLRRGHQLVTPTPPDMPPILKSDLLQAFFDRHRDSDYGFQHEFELLPDRFTDRTTRASEARENLYKNRYPDIKCYDQTRVKLTQIDGIFGSDYINANFVLGYEERKKFICAQGPMENTVCDYWRMIWEQHLELVLMLTNLEEYSKTKCAKYWPDKGETKNFGDITVEHVSELPYSNYMVRELKMTRTGERETRNIIQYHFLVWKDFVAPEHPHAILRFIKRVNEAYSLEKGPILVHCSAGVGRTGTLVALDSLLQQLAEEGQVSIFNTVCDIRHQRNFLVQSLKQYIFIYRALVEMAQFGDTEIHANQLKAHVEKLRQKENGKEKCRMEEEYDKVNAVIEDRKSFSVGGADENKPKNRSETVIPYDRNRVILTPIPGREHSTYINASFIEGYDNSESFIITQDPLDTTIPDFWRMISEQSITTIVMLSELAEGAHKCPRYWPDDEVAHNHIKVQYIQSESCPYYTRREFCVSNTKTDENTFVTQYQYNGWPTVEGEVPEVTRGLIELIDETQFKDTETTSPLVVHCHLGSDRSSMFVDLSILVQQLRTEKRVDIFMTTKKLRSQRHEMINTFTQYEFLHRAIVNYLDLHKLADEETNSQ